MALAFSSSCRAANRRRFLAVEDQPELRSGNPALCAVSSVSSPGRFPSRTSIRPSRLEPLSAPARGRRPQVTYASGQRGLLADASASPASRHASATPTPGRYGALRADGPSHGSRLGGLVPRLMCAPGADAEPVTNRVRASPRPSAHRRRYGWFSCADAGQSWPRVIVVRNAKRRRARAAVASHPRRPAAASPARAWTDHATAPHPSVAGRSADMDAWSPGSLFISGTEQVLAPC